MVLCRHAFTRSTPLRRFGAALALALTSITALATVAALTTAAACATAPSVRDEGAGAPPAVTPPAAPAKTAPAPTDPPTPGKSPKVRLETTLGTIVVELDPVAAPLSTANFLAYVDDGFYDGLVFHRVISTFMIQGGGFSPDLVKKPTRAPIENESLNGLSNQRGTIAMARTAAAHSATSQFYINVEDNPNLDGDAAAMRHGYAVFGRVIEGMDVVDAIRAVPTGVQKTMRDVPLEPVVITRARRVQAVPEAPAPAATPEAVPAGKGGEAPPTSP